MQTRKLKQFFRTLPISLLIVASIWVLTMVFLLVLPSFSSVTVTVLKQDREVVEDLRRLATWMVVATTFCGAALGICVPLAVRWVIKRRTEKLEEKVVT